MCYIFSSLLARLPGRLPLFVLFLAVAFVRAGGDTVPVVEIYRLHDVELEINRASGGVGYATFTRRAELAPARRLATGVPLVFGDHQAKGGGEDAITFKIVFSESAAVVSAATGTLADASSGAGIDGTYQLQTPEQLLAEGKVRAEMTDAELNRVYTSIKARLKPAKVIELRDVQREWLRYVYDEKAIERNGTGELAELEYWRVRGDLAAARISFLNQFATGDSAAADSELRNQLKAAQESGAWLSVAEIARRILEGNSKDAAVWEQRARAFLQAEDWVRCGKTLDEWTKAMPQRAAVIDDIRGDAELGLDHEDAAVAAWIAYLRAVPKDVDVRDKLAALYAGRGEWREAAKVLEQRNKLVPNAESLANLAICHAALRDFKQAGSDIRKASSIDATNDLVKKTFPRVERLEKAAPQIKKLDAAVGIVPKKVSPLIERGNFWLALGWPELAVQDGAAAMTLWDESKAGAVLKAESLISLGRTKEADAMDLEVKSPFPPEAALLALAKADDALMASGPTAPTLAVRAHRLNSVGETDLALVDADAALKLDPKCDAALAARGEALIEKERTWEALHDLTLAIEINPKNALAWFCRAQIEKRRHEFQAAIDAVGQVLAIEPANRDALALRSECYRSLGNLPAADADAALLKSSAKP